MHIVTANLKLTRLQPQSQTLSLLNLVGRFAESWTMASDLNCSYGEGLKAQFWDMLNAETMKHLLGQVSLTNSIS
jgi:hypothetical protein